MLCTRLLQCEVINPRDMLRILSFSHLLLDTRTRDKVKVCCQLFALSLVYMSKGKWQIEEESEKTECPGIPLNPVLNKCVNMTDPRTWLWKRLIGQLLIKAFFFVLGILEKCTDNWIGCKNSSNWACYLTSSMLASY